VYEKIDYKTSIREPLFLQPQSAITTTTTTKSKPTETFSKQTPRRGRVVTCGYFRHMASPKLAWPALSLHIILSLSLSLSLFVGFFWFLVSRHDFSFD
jgi:hypothetical protein